MQMPSLYKKYHYLPKRDQKQFFAFPEKLGNDQIPFFFAKLPSCYVNRVKNLKNWVILEILTDFSPMGAKCAATGCKQGYQGIPKDPDISLH